MKNILSKILIICFILLCSFIVGNLLVFAKAVPYKVQAPDIMQLLPNGQKRGDRIYISEEDLLNTPSLFCCGDGKHLTSKLYTAVKDGRGNSTYVTDSGKETAYMLASDIGEKCFETDWSDWELEIKNPYRVTRSETYGLYGVIEIKVATPKEAYILTEMENNVGEKWNYVQHAWWTTDIGSSQSGGSTSNMKHSDLADEAAEFENYVLQVAGASSADGLTYDENNYPILNYNVNMKSDNVKVMFDAESNKYKIGPMSVGYVRSVVQCGSRDKISFAGITGSSLIGIAENGDGTEREVAIDSSNYRFIYDNSSDHEAKKPSIDSDYIYPYSNEEFYIELDYLDDVTKIKSFKFDFQWMNASGKYQVLDGDYLTFTWQPKNEVKTKEEVIENDAKSETIEKGSNSSNSSEDTVTINDDFGFEEEFYVDNSKNNLLEDLNDLPINLIKKILNKDTEKPKLKSYTVKAEPTSIRMELDCTSFNTIAKLYGGGKWDISAIQLPDGNFSVHMEGDKLVIVGTNLTPETKYQVRFPKHKVFWAGIPLVWELYNREWVFEFSTTVDNFKNEEKGEPDEELEPSTEKPDKKNEKTTITYYKSKYWLEATKVESKEAQRIANGLEGQINENYKNEEFVNGVWDLRTSISGQVWVQKDAREPALKNSVEVLIYKVTYEKQADGSLHEIAREMALGWDNQEVSIDFSNRRIFIDDQGRYTIPNIQVPSRQGNDGTRFVISYDVEFIYDGQTYEAAEFGDNSYVIENAGERKEFDSYFTNIYGRDEINVENGLTNGLSNNYSEFGEEIKETELNYQASFVGEEPNQKLVSDLITNDSEGYVLNQYRFGARTSQAGYLLPHERQYHIEKYDGILTCENRAYAPIDGYFNNVNLGLLERYNVDLNVIKDLYSAKVIVNEQQVEYSFNEIGDIPNNVLAKQIEAEYRERNYKIDLYNSDYYYRSSVYSSITDEVTREILTQIKKNTELRLFVTYKIVANNESEFMDVSINELKDYYSNSFTLVDSDREASILDNNGERHTEVVAVSPYYVKGTEIKEAKFENEVQINNEYKRMTLESLKDEKLAPGEKVEVYVTYEVDSQGFEEAVNEEYGQLKERINLLGEKNNIVEITNYSTFYTPEAVQRHKTVSYAAGNISGRIDKNSAPDNININNMTSMYFEDDTEIAPKLTINCKKENNRQIKGIVWEDSRLQNEEANGIYDFNEQGIGNIDVQLVEKIKVNPNDLNDKISGYENLDYEFEFIWPDNAFGEENNFTSKTQTSDNENKGQYVFSNFVPGMYVVRFEYGNKKESIYYNGQDYKNTAYQVGMTNVNATYSEDGSVVTGTSNVPGALTLNNEWHDLSSNESARNLNSSERRVSDARDYEPRRIQTIAYSRTITNQNAESLDDDNKLIQNTSMIANTAKLNVEVEKQDTIFYKDKETTKGRRDSNYEISNIDFGLVRRPETILSVKQEVSKIELFKDDGKTRILFVECDENGDIKRTVVDSSNIDNVAEIEKSKLGLGSQGFKYIPCEESYLNGMRIVITYRIDVSNDSEIDYIGKELKDIKNMSELYKIALDYELSPCFNTGENIVYGKYLGLHYYTNTTEARDSNDLLEQYGYSGYTDEIVTTTVDQLVDYIDNDISIDKERTVNIEDQSWEESTDNDLKNKFSKLSYKANENGEFEATKEKFVDNKNRSYFGTGKNNIVVSYNEQIAETDIMYSQIKLNGNQKVVIKNAGTVVPDTVDVLLKNMYTSKDINENVSGYNPNLTKEMEPGENRVMYISTSVQTSEDELDNMNYDNLVEILVYSNVAGRKDPLSIPGNANYIAKEKPAYQAGYNWTTGEIATERDAYAARDTVTLSEPTGLSTRRIIMNDAINGIAIIIMISVIAITVIVVLEKTKKYRIKNKK